MLTIYNWEKGKTRPQAKQLEKWLAVKGIGKRKAWGRLGDNRPTDSCRSRQLLSNRLPAAQLSIEKAVRSRPPDTVAWSPPAVLSLPPLTDAQIPEVRLP